MKKKTKIALGIILALLIAVGVGTAVYLSDYYRADEAAAEAMRETSTVQVTQDGDVTWFIPENATAGLIFYPGGKVEHTAYAPLMQLCAEKGIACALVKMPGNLAVFDPSAAEGLTQAHPEITHWYIGGHSLGGAMAAKYAAAHSDELDGLILLAAYSTEELTQTKLRVLSVYGSCDGVLNRESYAENRSNLPQDFTERIIEGGCHAYFGSYGAQDGDGTPTISRHEQLELTVQYIAELVMG